MHSNAYPSVPVPAADMANKTLVAAVERLIGSDFVLDPIRGVDAQRLEVLADDSEFQRWLPWVRGGFTKSRAEEFARDFSEANWASGQPVWALRMDGVLMGVVDLRNRFDDAWEIGFWMHPEARGRGVMTQACDLVVGAAFAHLGARRILHFARVGNYRSLRIARNLGFRPEGVRRKYTPLGVERQWQSSLLKSDWLNRNPRPLQRVVDEELLDGARPAELVAEMAHLSAGSGPGHGSSPSPPPSLSPARTPSSSPTSPPSSSPTSPPLASSSLPSSATGPVDQRLIIDGSTSAAYTAGGFATGSLAALVYSAYELADEAGVDMENALRRAHRRRIADLLGD